MEEAKGLGKEKLGGELGVWPLGSQEQSVYEGGQVGNSQTL